MARICTVIFGGSVLLLAASVYAQSDDHSKGRVEQCRKLADAEARLACYDRIGRSDPAGVDERESRPDAAPESDPSSTGPETEGSGYGTLTEDTGLTKAAAVNKPIPVTVSRCGEATNFKFYFYLDNGQVWRYIGGGKLRLRSCDGAAFLVEDRFGYTLQLDGDSARLRVKRVK